MIIKTDLLQEGCKAILNAVDTGTKLSVAESLELLVENKILYLNVTNNEYYVSIKHNLDVPDSFRAVVNAGLFLNLVSKITSETIELTADEKTLNIKANGNYKIPLVYENGTLLNLGKITIDNPTTSFNIDGKNLLSILTYNSKELEKENFVHPAQMHYYLDEHGCITFTSGACVNNFDLPSPVKVLLPRKIVKLFKLLSGNVKFTMGFDNNGSITQQKVRFENDTVSITAILLNDESMMQVFPVTAIRNLASAQYNHSIEVDKNSLIEAIDRILIFQPKDNVDGVFTYTGSNITLFDKNKINTESISIVNPKPLEKIYEVGIDLEELRSKLSAYNDSHVVINLGNDKSPAIVIAMGNYKSVIQVKQ